MAETLQERIWWLLLRGTLERFKAARQEPGRRGDLAREIDGPIEVARWLEDPVLGGDPAVLEALLESGEPEIKLAAAGFAPAPLAASLLRDVLAIPRTGPDGRAAAIVRLLGQRGADMATYLDMGDIERIGAFESVGPDNVILALVAQLAGFPQRLQGVVDANVPLRPGDIRAVSVMGGEALSRLVPYEAIIRRLDEPRGGVRGAGEWEETWMQILVAAGLPWKGEGESLQWLPREEVCARLRGAIGNMFASGHVLALRDRVATEGYLGEEDYLRIAESLRDQWLKSPGERPEGFNGNLRRGRSGNSINVASAVQTLLVEGVTPYWRTLAGAAVARVPKRLVEVLRVRQEFRNLTGMASEPLLLEEDSQDMLSQHSDGTVRAALLLALDDIQTVPPIDKDAPVSSRFLTADPVPCLASGAAGPSGRPGGAPRRQ